LSGEGRQAYTERLKDIAMKPVRVIADEARDLVPVVTGRLKAGIFAAPLTKRVGAIVGVHNVVYAPWVEYGTVHASAHPFLRPAVNATRPLFANMMAGDLKALIDEVSRDNAWHASEAA
jgi:HK97 gp10 family phage protein